MHPAFATPRDSLGAETPDLTVPVNASAPCSRALIQRVGDRLRRADLSAAELDQHIEDLTRLWMDAYARFQAHGNPVDREDALLWLHTRDRTHLERSRIDCESCGDTERRCTSTTSGTSRAEWSGSTSGGNCSASARRATQRARRA
jgi:hypothetical protein